MKVSCNRSTANRQVQRSTLLLKCLGFGQISTRKKNKTRKKKKKKDQNTLVPPSFVQQDPLTHTSHSFLKYPK